MGVPAVIAFKERDNLLQLVMYAFLAIAVIYTLYKLFGVFKEAGEKVEEVKSKVTEFFSDTKNEVEYRVKHPDEAPARFANAVVNPQTPLDKLQQVGYNIVNPFAPLATQVINKAQKDEEYRKQVIKNTKTSLISGIVPAYGAYQALKNLLHHDDKKSSVKPHNISMKEYGDIQAKRWEALAKKTSPSDAIPQEHGAKPIDVNIPHFKPGLPSKSEMERIAKLREHMRKQVIINPTTPHILPVRRDLRLL